MTVQQTSLLTYHNEIKPALNGRQLEVYNFLYYRGPMTNLEIAKAMGREINTITPRIFELREKGMIVEDCQRKCNITGRMAISWKVNK